MRISDWSSDVCSSDLIPKRGDQPAMGPLMQYGTYAAGMALQAAGVAGDDDLLGRTHLLAASGGGERDVALDQQILATRSAERRVGNKCVSPRTCRRSPYH